MVVTYRVVDTLSDEKTTASDVLRLLSSRSFRLIHHRADFLHRKTKTLQGWIRRQEEYLLSLSWQDQAAIVAYTFDGHSLINAYLRGELTQDRVFTRRFFRIYRKHLLALGVGDLTTIDKYEDMIRRVGEIDPSGVEFRSLFEKYIARLDVIIRGAPPLPCPLMVYRGVRYPKGQVKIRRVTLPWYLSTTLSVCQAREFIPPKRRCCLLRMRVPKGSCALFLPLLSYYPQEMEILLPRGAVLKNLDRRTRLERPTPVDMLEYILE